MRRAAAILFVALLAAGCATVPDVRYRADISGDQPDFQGDHFMRYNGYEDVAGQLQVGAVTYSTADKKTKVTLVGAIHIADAAYYGEVQRRLDGADLVYYELVKPEAMDYPPPGGVQADGMYSGMADLFGLSEQMACVGYDRDHFRWLDMSAEVFGARVTEIIQRAVLRLSEVFGAAVDLDDQQAFGQALRSATPEIQAAFIRCLAQFRAPDPIAWILDLIYMPLRFEKGIYAATKGEKAFEDKYKHTLAGGFQADTAQQLDGLGGDPLSDILLEALAEFQHVIVDERNAIVVGGIRDLVSSGKAPARVAVFYGAAHNPGIEQGLLELGMTRDTDVDWMVAIDIR